MALLVGWRRQQPWSGRVCDSMQRHFFFGVQIDCENIVPDEVPERFSVGRPVQPADRKVIRFALVGDARQFTGATEFQDLDLPIVVEARHGSCRPATKPSAFVDQSPSWIDLEPNSGLPAWQKLHFPCFRWPPATRVARRETKRAARTPALAEPLEFTGRRRKIQVGDFHARSPSSSSGVVDCTEAEPRCGAARIAPG